jgi:hypothetical protein
MRQRVAYLLTFVFVALAVSSFGIVGASVWRSRGCVVPGHDGAFLAYCGNTAFGDYEHGALYYGFEPRAIQNLQAAAVLILGNSRSQFAFSNPEVDQYFTGRGIKYFLLGFGYGEMSELPLAIMRKYGVKPKVIIANADPFFSHQLSEPTEAIFRGTPSTWAKYLLKKVTLDLLPNLCKASPSSCASPSSLVYRSVINGSWDTVPAVFPQTTTFPFNPVLDPFDQNLIDFWSIAGREFLQETKIDRRCVVLTGVPAPDYAGIALAKGMADKLDLTLVNVTAPNMATMDHAHLNADTARRWSKIFLDRAGPIIERCLGR